MTYDAAPWNGLIDLLMYLGLALIVIGAICLLISFVIWLGRRNDPANINRTRERGNPFPPDYDPNQGRRR